MRNELTVIAAAMSLMLVACDKKPSPAPSAEAATPSKLGDLSMSLTAARSAFNARKGEARFLTLLSPT